MVTDTACCHGPFRHFAEQIGGYAYDLPALRNANGELALPELRFPGRPDDIAFKTKQEHKVII